ncbi:hypothetical protein [Pseudomonas sp. NMI795_08]|uniref:hypothetical protein n=1 Tax=Pseudomonas sp. NMI795_08 TaxID=2903144 RepID=UPI001E4754CD|nr:hypothetical protein [Pseudomonas sp. NMI795_08]MCE1118593.1 hypothetical protein [Pseudomonas sp. NMI795_08]
MKTLPFPCFFGINEILQLNGEDFERESPYVISQLQCYPAELLPLESYALIKRFLQANAVSTRYSVYRSAIERLFLWCLLIQRKPVTELDEIDVRCFMDFCLCPPDHWVAPRPEKRLMRASTQRSCKTLIVNPSWRPFRPGTKNLSMVSGGEKLSASSSLAVVMAVVNQFYLYLCAEDVLDRNPAYEIHRSRQYASMYATHEGHKSFSKAEWDQLVEIMEEMADSDPDFERKLFLIMTIYYLRLQPVEIERLSNLLLMKSLCKESDDTYRLSIPFFPELENMVIPLEFVDRWVARFRVYLGTHMRPLSRDSTPMISTQSGRGGISSRHANLIFKSICKQVVAKLEARGFKVPGDSAFRNASLLWVRETSLMRLAESLSFDDFRPMIRGSTGDAIFARYYAWQQKKRGS